MSVDLLTKVETENGTFVVLTKTRHLVLFNTPHSSVVPLEARKFVAKPRFQVRYNTPKTAVLSEWHEMLCVIVRNGLLRLLRERARLGFFPYPEDKKHLARYVKKIM